MQTTYIKGYEVQVFKGWNDQELFITKNGKTVYSCRLVATDSAMKRAHLIINQQ